MPTSATCADICYFFARHADWLSGRSGSGIISSCHPCAISFFAIHFLRQLSPYSLHPPWLLYSLKDEGRNRLRLRIKVPVLMPSERGQIKEVFSRSGIISLVASIGSGSSSYSSTRSEVPIVKRFNFYSFRGSLEYHRLVPL